MSTILSTWANTPITPADTLSSAAWTGAAQMAIPGGFLWVKNDATYMYAALDISGDTVNSPSTDDWFWFSFDRDRNGSITPYYDYNYGLYPGNPNKIGHQLTIAPGEWTGLFAESATGASCHEAFEGSPHLAVNHRIWKLKFPLADLNVTMGSSSLLPPFTKFGIHIHSQAPAIDAATPANLTTSYADLNTVFFSRSPVIPAGIAGAVIACVGLIPTTVINAAGNATTAAGYQVTALNAPFGGTLDLIGNATTLHSLILAGATKYKIEHCVGIGGAFSDFRSSWYNYVWNGSTFEYDLFSADVANYYVIPDPLKAYSISNLLCEFNSTNLSKGLHQFKAVFYNAANVVVPTVNQVLTININNDLPVVKIDSITHAGVNVAACDIVKMTSPADGLVFTIDAYDPDGNMGSLELSAGWGYGDSEGIFGESYTLAMGAWTGVQNLRCPATGVWVPPATCAYGFTLAATPRTTNGYENIGYTQVSEYITIMLS